jgi:hypothetical protein
MTSKAGCHLSQRTLSNGITVEENVIFRLHFSLRKKMEAYEVLMLCVCIGRCKHARACPHHLSTSELRD